MENNIQELLDKYFAGETTLQEESVLKEYFNGNKVNAAHLQYQPLFQYFEKERLEIVNDGFDKKVLKQVEGENNVLKMRIVRNRVFRFAAMFLLVIAAWFVVQQTLVKTPKTIEERWAEHEIKDPEKAFEATKAALLFASSKFNRGTKKAAGGVVKIQKVSKYFKTNK